MRNFIAFGAAGFLFVSLADRASNAKAPNKQGADREA